MVENSGNEEYVKIKKSVLEELKQAYKNTLEDLQELHGLNDQILQGIIDTGLLPKEGEDEKQVSKRFNKVMRKAAIQFGSQYMKGDMDITKVKEIKPLASLKPVAIRINEIVSKYGESKAEVIIQRAIQGGGESGKELESGENESGGSEGNREKARGTADSPEWSDAREGTA